MADERMDGYVILDSVIGKNVYQINKEKIEKPIVDPMWPVPYAAIKVVGAPKEYKHSGFQNDDITLAPFSITTAIVGLSKNGKNAPTSHEVVINNPQKRVDLIKQCRDAGVELIKIRDVHFNPEEVEGYELGGIINKRVHVAFKDGDKWEAPKEYPLEAFDCQLGKKIKARQAATPSMP